MRFVDPSAPSKQSAAAAALGLHSLLRLLHRLADQLLRLKELGRAAVQTNGLALVELALAVLGWQALGVARIG